MGHHTLLWAREQEVVADVNGPDRENKTFLKVGNGSSASLAAARSSMRARMPAWLTLTMAMCKSATAPAPQQHLHHSSTCTPTGHLLVLEEAPAQLPVL